MKKNPGCMIPVLFFTLGPLIFAGLGVGKGMSETSQAVTLFIFLILCFFLAFIILPKMEESKKSQVKEKTKIIIKKKYNSLEDYYTQEAEAQKEAEDYLNTLAADEYDSKTDYMFPDEDDIRNR
jgi:C-terminal processing protease CtpA/Prc